MSHISNISNEGIEFELPVIQALCQRQGWPFLDKKNFRWYGQFMGDSAIPEGFSPEDYGKCEYAIRIPGCNYELGVVKSRTGSGKYQILGDFWYEGGLNAVLGEQGEVFRQLYLQQADIMDAEAKGWNWEEAPASVEGAKKLVLYVNDDDFGGGESWDGGGDW